MLSQTPSRLTVASGLSEALSAATASAALTVSYQPMVALMNWMARRMAWCESEFFFGGGEGREGGGEREEKEKGGEKR